MLFHVSICFALCTFQCWGPVPHRCCWLFLFVGLVLLFVGTFLLGLLLLLLSAYSTVFASFLLSCLLLPCLLRRLLALLLDGFLFFRDVLFLRLLCRWLLLQSVLLVLGVVFLAGFGVSTGAGAPAAGGSGNGLVSTKSESAPAAFLKTLSTNPSWCS